ncbi:MAG TPA: hypothetical protein VGC73_09930, partial [Pyrinomonadaceae bacterium]
ESTIRPSAVIGAAGQPAIAGESIKPGTQAPGFKELTIMRARDIGRHLSPAIAGSNRDVALC